ncbi:energy transducer TonB [Brevundimonas aveniformis]|uniref:energy transducer TonB n=1 Tax=Brevundimonas aveniformis TaxID=370977 RepID=UPI0006840881|nr:energy transducer TonB [Brevundimonas aveniformis]
MSAQDVFHKPAVRKAGLVLVVVLAHALLFAGLILVQPRYVPSIPAPPILVELIRPEREPPPEPPRPVSPQAGGGAPATPSRVRPAEPPPRPVEPEIYAPPEPAPEPVQTIGASPLNTAGEGRGQGGQGTGTGSGVGAGSGPGSGAGRAVLLSGPSLDQIRRAQPRTGLAVRRVGRAEMRCRIRLDGRMEGCSVTREMPPGSRLGQAALSLAPHYRWRPPTDGQGRPVDNSDIIIGVDFPP